MFLLAELYIYGSFKNNFWGEASKKTCLGPTADMKEASITLSISLSGYEFLRNSFFKSVSSDKKFVKEELILYDLSTKHFIRLF